MPYIFYRSLLLFKLHMKVFLDVDFLITSQDSFVLLEIFCLSAIYYPTKLIKIDRAAHFHNTSIIHIIIWNLFGVSAYLDKSFFEHLIFVVVLVADQAELQYLFALMKVVMHKQWLLLDLLERFLLRCYGSYLTWFNFFI